MVEINSIDPCSYHNRSKQKNARAINNDHSAFKLAKQNQYCFEQLHNMLHDSEHTFHYVALPANKTG